MKEIELKFRVGDFSSIRKKLRALGAKLLWKGTEENWLFDTPDFKIWKGNQTLRIKTMGDTSLTLKTGKKVVQGAKVAEEHQIMITDAKIGRIILEKLGYSVTLHYKKYREHWRIGTSFVELDTLEDGRKFAEIESTHKGIKNLAQKLRLDFSKSTPESYTKLLTGNLKKGE
ncbi:MAG: hypothetical protein A2131_02670 [Candidatus Sungbacteria bacterium GWC2_49_10]|uniref:Adenylate cyclase n=2 Tax=Parcubacteria group TaxID=1794811 RepID=A0A0G1WSW0_9BACT|nr:MAG: Adenylate cyclase [Parcubacteria group bacterium GW2011_GWB1_50_9]KKW21630.1 MAG: Adenylate cyclase [Candidatus Adlerbacteria bacterium GW2011_GWC1_50_9]OGZ94755.1 MAG: hypothetical protein A2131_02670 [Candidatus Sungbacteria bacterium GWC2_49_10]